MTESLHVWITGAGRGIGASIAHTLAGAHRVSLSDRTEDSVLDVARLLPTGSYYTAACDVSDATQVASTHAKLIAHHGPVDVLVNNAGIGIFKSMIETSVEEFDEQVNVNLRGTFLCTKSVLPAMIARRSGMIITMNSVSAFTAFTGCASYGASKAGALAMTRSLRNEVRDHGIKVTDIMLGATDTGIWSETARLEHGARMMRADDVAATIRDIISGFYNPRTHMEEIIMRPQKGDL